MNGAPRIYILILNWNGKDNTIACLRSVQSIDYPNYNVVVIDNGSTDGSIPAIRQEFPEVEILENGANLGYAGGNNRGISYAISKATDYIFVLNNDTTVDPQILKNLIQTSDQYPEAGILGTKIYYQDEPNKIWFAGGRWLSDIGQTGHIGHGQIDDSSEWNKVCSIDYACGCALFIRSEVVQKVGLLEEKYFLTWEETDYCYKARRAGFDCLYAPSAVVWHKVSASFKGGETGLLQQYFMYRNRLLWIERNLELSEKLNIYRKVILPEIKFRVRTYLSPKSDPKFRTNSKIILVAFIDYLARRFGDCPSWIRVL